MSHRDDCIFCRIIRGDAPCFRVHEDELTISFLDVFPSAPGHLLIVTKDHFSDIFDADPAALARVGSNSAMMARAIESVFSPDGLGIYQLNRPAAGQTVFHYHMHLIPRTAGGGLDVHAKSAGDPQQLESHAEQLRAALAN